LFLLPILKNRMVWRGLLVSLGPTVLQLFYFFPHGGAGIAGTELGLITPLFVLFFNAIWGLATALWLHWSDYSY
jgi:hypothetical protein